jgi:hypothetical protein
MGVSDGGSGGDVCLDSTPSGVRSAIAVTSVNDVTNRGDNVTAIPAYDCVVKIFYAAIAMTDDAADAVADTADERSPVATVNATAASIAASASARHHLPCRRRTRYKILHRCHRHCHLQRKRLQRWCYIFNSAANECASAFLTKSSDDGVKIVKYSPLPPPPSTSPPSTLPPPLMPASPTNGGQIINAAA